MSGQVIALSKRSIHAISKLNYPKLKLITGIGVEGDVHAGKTIKHRSRVAVDPTQINLRQVHLIHSELFEELQQKGFHIHAGQMGENITTKGIKLLQLPRHTLLHIGKEVILEVTGLRNPCAQLNGLQKGLLKAVVEYDKQGKLIRKAGIMSIVRQGGWLKLGDNITIELPHPPFLPLERV